VVVFGERMTRSIDQLVNQQVLRWMKEERAARERGKGPAREAQQPMITISREFGARGAEIGQIVAERLHFRFYAQELVHEIAKQAQVRQQVVESLDERVQDRIEQWVGDMIEGRLFAPTDYLRNLSRVVLTLGRHGKGVLIGRGAQLLLDAQRTLRIRAFAPLETRIEHVAKREGLGTAEARAWVLRVDAERIAFYRQHFNADVASPELYDLLLNTGTLSIEACADLVMAAFRARFGA
jgi:Cytidylate kinase-like family